jgi:hypothetical protein
MTVMVIGHKDSIHIAQSQYLVIMSFAIYWNLTVPLRWPVSASLLMRRQQGATTSTVRSTISLVIRGGGS